MRWLAGEGGTRCGSGSGGRSWSRSCDMAYREELELDELPVPGADCAVDVEDVVSVLGLAAPLVVEDEMLPLPDMDAVVDVSVDGDVVALLELGDEVSLDAVVVGGVTDAVVVVVVDPGVALVPELL